MRNDWDVPRLKAWNKYSEQHPPLHLLFAAYCGFKPSKPAADEPGEDVLAFLLGIPGLSQK